VNAASRARARCTRSFKTTGDGHSCTLPTRMCEDGLPLLAVRIPPHDEV